MRLALISDIHGNPLALDAVLADIEAQGGVDETIFLGDYAALGYDPDTALDLANSVPHATYIRGNTDRLTVAFDDLIPKIVENVREHPEETAAEIEVARSFAWTQGYVTSGGWLDWLADLPVEHRRTLPDGTRLLCVHASPGRDDGPGFNPRQTDAERASLLAGCGADLVAVGHVHLPQDYRVGDVRLINIASVSNPMPPDLRAKYALLDADERGYAVTFRQVTYDVGAVIEALERVNHPGRRYLLEFFRGTFVPSWARE